MLLHPSKQRWFSAARSGWCIWPIGKTGAFKYSEPSGILGPGHHIATDSKGNIYLAHTTAGMQKLVFKGMPPTQ